MLHHQVAAERHETAQAIQQIVFARGSQEAVVVFVECFGTFVIQAARRGVTTGIYFLVLGCRIIVGTAAQLDIEPIGRCILQRYISQKAVTGIVVLAIFGHPVRVFLRVLGRVPPDHIAFFVHTVFKFLDIQGTGQAVYRVERIRRVHPLDRAVMGIHIDIVHFGINLPFLRLIEECGGTQRDVRLIQLRFRCDAGIIRTVDRGKDGSPVDILLETDTFVKRGSGTEEGIDIVICPERNLVSKPVRHHLPFHFRPPTQAGLIVVNADRSLSEAVLHIRFQEDRFGRDTGIHRNPQTFVFPSRFGRDQDHAVTCPRTVKGGCRCTFQDRHRLDVFGIDIGEAVTHIGSGVTPDIIHTAGKVIHRRTVHHDQRLVTAGQRTVTAKHDLRRTSHPVTGADDLQTGDFTGQRIGKIRFAGRQQLVSLQFLHGIA